jgi:hypothetical protein
MVLSRGHCILSYESSLKDALNRGAFLAINSLSIDFF